MDDKRDTTNDTEEGPGRRSNFIRDVVDADVAAGTYGGRVVTRFPPEPNGFLHIGHAKAIWINYGIARDYGGQFNLRFDDTNPDAEEQRYVDGIIEDIGWLGCDWGEHLYFASDYFPKHYELAEELIGKGLAYVDSQSLEQIREHRGTVTEAGVPSPFRDRTVEENLDLFRRMKAGEFAEGAHVLRAKLDMASNNMLLRDPVLYRIKHTPHHRQGDAWCIYPLYDFAHGYEDAIEGVTHSLCSLEFEVHRELYDWLLAQVWPEPRPKQLEFARLNLEYTVMSKRRIIPLVESGLLSGWDDPRMSTLRGLRRRGVTPEAIRDFCDLIGVARVNSMVDVGKFEYCIREDLNHRAPRVLCVLDPVPVTITTWPEGHTEQLDAAYWPHDVPNEGSRTITMSREILIEREDFAAEPPKGWRRLSPGWEVRLRHGYVIRCDEVVRDDDGNVVRLLCSHDADTLGENPDRKIKGTIHWVDADTAVRCEVRLYDRLFRVQRPGADPDVPVEDEVNPASLVTRSEARIEASVLGDAHDTRYQFERQGYFWRDPVDSSEDALVFNRIVSLKDSWAKAKKPAAPARRPKPKPSGPAKPRVFAAGDPSLAAQFERYTTDLGVDPETAQALTRDAATATFFEAAAAGGDAATMGTRVVNLLPRDVAADALPFGPADFAALVKLVDGKRISATAGKDVLAAMLAGEGDPASIVAAKGLEQVSDEGALAAAVDAVIAAHPDEAARYRDGKLGLLGFFVGRVMKQTRGKANPELVKKLVVESLA